MTPNQQLCLQALNQAFVDNARQPVTLQKWRDAAVKLLIAAGKSAGAFHAATEMARSRGLIK